jgi:hypothetical protein
MGHGDHLRDGVMFALHAHAIGWLLDRCGAAGGPRYLMYSAWEDGQDSLRQWKQRAGFEPYKLHAGPRIAAIGRNGAGPFPTALLEGMRSAAAFFCAAF